MTVLVLVAAVAAAVAFGVAVPDNVCQPTITVQLHRLLSFGRHHNLMSDSFAVANPKQNKYTQQTYIRTYIHTHIHTGSGKFKQKNIYIYLYYLV